MIFCFGTVCWGGYLERYVNMFVKNYITIYRGLIRCGIKHDNIVDPRIVYVSGEDEPGQITEMAMEKLKQATGKKLKLICDKHKYTQDTIMYSTRNRLRLEFKRAYPNEKKVYFYFPIDDEVRPEAVLELYNLSRKDRHSACMFKFVVDEGSTRYTAGTRPINSYRDINPGDWGGYCAYTIFEEDDCPLYPEISIPNIAFYIELYKAGYIEYQSKEICINHLRHTDSHHYKTKDTKMSSDVKDYLLMQKKELEERGINNVRL